MNIACYIYSEEDDSLYVDHLKKVIHTSRTHVRILYRIGREKNCEENKICSTVDRHDFSHSVFIRSYKFVSNFKQIPNTFFWVNPKYNAITYGNKLIAIDGEKDDIQMDEILKQFIGVDYKTEMRFLSNHSELKHFALSEKRINMILK